MDSEQAGRDGREVHGDGGSAGEAATPAPLPADGRGGAAPPAAPVPPADRRLPRPPSPKSFLRAQWLPLTILVCGLLGAYYIYDRNRRELLSGLQTGAEQVKIILTGGPAPNPYAEAVLKMEGDRGEATGRRVRVEIPEELKQYSEARRFLAIQGAAASEAGVRSPHDFAELAETIREGRELVEVPRLGRGYVLYGVGLTATGALTHYDLKQRKVVPLFADVAEVEAAEAGIVAERTRLSGELKELEGGLKGLGVKEREERARLLAEAASRKKDLAALTEREELIEAYYGKPGAKERARVGERLFAEHAVLAGLARDFGGRAYDLRDQASAKEFQARMLSHVRPATLALLEELATAYEAKFERPLPVTSLVRTEEYQRLLRESGNPNAADVAPPPHTTGFAFDVYYRYMTAEEQEFVMAEVARLEKAGRVEALRELRDHYHIFVFAEGRKPSEETVNRLLGRRGRRPEKAETEVKMVKEVKTAKAEKQPKTAKGTQGGKGKRR